MRSALATASLLCFAICSGRQTSIAGVSVPDQFAISAKFEENVNCGKVKAGDTIHLQTTEDVRSDAGNCTAMV
jgi:hypothetical protein